MGPFCFGTGSREPREFILRVSSTARFTARRPRQHLLAIADHEYELLLPQVRAIGLRYQRHLLTIAVQ